jgi:hypothetical protein
VSAYLLWLTLQGLEYSLTYVKLIFTNGLKVIDKQ